MKTKRPHLTMPGNVLLLRSQSPGTGSGLLKRARELQLHTSQSLYQVPPRQSSQSSLGSSPPKGPLSPLLLEHPGPAVERFRRRAFFSDGNGCHGR